MASFYRASVEEFLEQTEEHVLARLATAYANRGYTTQYSDQTLTWERDLHSLKEALKQCVLLSDSARIWGIILEFSIPRKELRIDVVLLVGNEIVILEAKTGQAASQAKQQIEEYALLLHYFHKGSDQRRIVPIIVSPHSVMAGEYWVYRERVLNMMKYLLTMMESTRMEMEQKKFGLTLRELDIVSAVVASYSNKEIAECFEITEDSVKHHLHNIFDKLGVSTRLELALFAVYHKLPLKDVRSAEKRRKP